jgi:pimeloyl-ACP methyl ester carboxylesterase
MLYQHGGGQSIANYLTEALVLAELGVTSLLVDVGMEKGSQGVVELVGNERRALDLLLRQAGVDAKRIGYVGHSYGGFAGGILSGVEPRIGAFALLGAVPEMGRHMRESRAPYWEAFRARPDSASLIARMAAVEAALYLPVTRASMLVQCARFDTPDNLRTVRRRTGWRVGRVGAVLRRWARLGR